MLLGAKLEVLCGLIVEMLMELDANGFEFSEKSGFGLESGRIGALCGVYGVDYRKIASEMIAEHKKARKRAGKSANSEKKKGKRAKAAA